MNQYWRRLYQTILYELFIFSLFNQINTKIYLRYRFSVTRKEASLYHCTENKHQLLSHPQTKLIDTIILLLCCPDCPLQPSVALQSRPYSSPPERISSSLLRRVLSDTAMEGYPWMTCIFRKLLEKMMMLVSLMLSLTMQRSLLMLMRGNLWHGQQDFPQRCTDLECFGRC